MTPIDLIVIAICLAIGGLVKGATGAGAPLLAIPALAAVFDVPFAVTILVLPNLLTNMWQMWQYRASRPPTGFLAAFVGGGAVGVAFGTWVLTALPTRTLSMIIAGVVLIYVVIRVTRPHWQLAQRAADILALPAGIIGGVLQGAIGISAPMSITFLSAMRLPRPVFIFSISTLFVTFVVVQIPALSIAGLMTFELAGLSLFAVVPILAAMPVGAALARRLPASMFDTLILVFLCGMAAKLLFDALM